jgi:hypothetical protein
VTKLQTALGRYLAYLIVRVLTLIHVRLYT